jgi:hypothetical protein
MDVGGVLELAAPGGQDTGATREVGATAPLVLGEALEGERRGMEHRVVREALMRAEQGVEGLGDGQGAEQVRPGQLSLQAVMKPRLGCRLLALGTVPVATGMLDAVLCLTVWALIEAMAIGAAAAVLDSADNLTVGGGEVGRALQILWRKGGADSAQGGHGRSPCMRVWRRS